MNARVPRSCEHGSIEPHSTVPLDPDAEWCDGPVAVEVVRNPEEPAKSDYPLRVLVCGGRDFDDGEQIGDVLSQYQIAAIAHGDARGADRLARDWGRSRGIPVYGYPADWRPSDRYDRAAGPKRNVRMLHDFQPDLVVAFHGGKGTAHMVSIAKSAGVEVLVVDASLELL